MRSLAHPSDLRVTLKDELSWKFHPRNRYMELTDSKLHMRRIMEFSYDLKLLTNLFQAFRHRTLA